MTEHTHKNLILDQMRDGMPTIGKDGYAGEQDGTQVIYDGVFLVASRNSIKNIKIGIDVHKIWCTYTCRGWEVSLGHWSDAEYIDISEMLKFERVA